MMSENTSSTIATAEGAVATDRCGWVVVDIRASTELRSDQRGRVAADR